MGLIWQICLYNWDKREAMPETAAKLRLYRLPEYQEYLDLLIEDGKVIKTQGGGLFVQRALVEAERAYELWEKKSRGGKRGGGLKNLKQNQTEAEESLKSDRRLFRSNENENENENENSSPNGEGVQGDMLDQIDPEIWKAFVEHRIKLKAPMTDRAAELMRKKLMKIYEGEAHPPNAVLEQSIERGWKGVFPLKDDGNGNGSGWDWTNGN